MATTEGRHAKVGVAAVIILMFSIVMFVGSLFYLSVHGPWEDSSPFEPRLTSVKYEEESILTQEEKSPRMKEFMLELSEANCTILFYDLDISNEGVGYLNYFNFKEKVLEKKVVICSEMENGELALLLLENSKIWLWKP